MNFEQSLSANDSLRAGICKRWVQRKFSVICNVRLRIYRQCLARPTSNLSYDEIMITFLINKYCSFSIKNHYNKCITHKILHHLYLITTSHDLKSTTSELGQWCPLKPRMIITALFEPLVDPQLIVVSLLPPEINEVLCKFLFKPPY